MRFLTSILLGIFLASLTILPSWGVVVVVVQPAAGGGGHTYLINEGFEGAGTPVSWFAGGSADFDSVTAPLAGSQSMRLNVTEFTLTPTINEAEIWVKFRFRMSALPSPAASVLVFRDSGFNVEMELGVNTDGTLQLGSTAVSVPVTVDGLSAGTSYDIEVHYITGTGITSVMSVGFVAAGGSIPTTGNKFTSCSDGFGNANIDHVLILDANCTDTDYDTFQISTTQNP